MSVSEIYRCARSLEAIENYACSDIIDLRERSPNAQPGDSWNFYSDEQFWHIVLDYIEDSWGKEIVLMDFALCHWVPRVPGLYWRKDSKAIRELANNAVEYRSREWTTLKPLGKSQIVLGGVGTIKFPPDANGYRLVSLSAGYNASSGIPALISPDVWSHHHLDQGAFLALSGIWSQMSTSWADRFPSIKGIPRGYLVVSEIQQIHRKSERRVPVQFHPFTVMEYSSGASRLFDFVYATADTRVRNYRRQLERFFEGYKSKKERYGRYLLSPDINDPIFDADYSSPAEMRQAEPGAQAQLRVLEIRVREQSFRGNAIDSILQLLSEKFDNDRLTRLSAMIGIPPALWFTNAAPADSAVQFMDICLVRDKVEELLDLIGREYPELVL